MIDTEVTPDLEVKGTAEPETATEGMNPLEGFFRANGVEPEEPSSDPFNESTIDEQVEEAPQMDSNQPVAQQETQDNDEKRYQYWQSEADKARNENAQLAQRLQALEQQVAQPQPTVEESESKSFPPPPVKPAKPRNFSRAEALEDQESESAKYLDDVDEWRDDMDDYNRLHSEYNLAMAEEERLKMKEERDAVLRQQAEMQQRQQQMNEIHTHLKGQYQASDEEIAQFVEIMDKPESVTLDNLFKLFRLQTGNQTAPAQQGQAPLTETNPNESFEQMQRAQQVPTSMGVVPSQGNAQGSREDQMMDSMIQAYNTKNPWGS